VTTTRSAEEQAGRAEPADARRALRIGAHAAAPVMAAGVLLAFGQGLSVALPYLSAGAAMMSGVVVGFYTCRGRTMRR
jgi:hypothetical protein